MVFDSVLLCSYPFSCAGPEMPSWNVTVKYQNSTVLLASWETPPQPFLNGSSVKEYIILYDTRVYPFTFARRVSSSQNEAKITDLDKFTEYKVQIVAIVEKNNVRGRSAAHFVQTDEDGMCEYVRG